MDRKRFRNILYVVLFSSELVLTQEVIYKKLNSTVKLVCPIIKSDRSITWFGPLDLKIYAVGKEVTQEVSTQVDINETADEKSILLIYRFTEDKSGKFRCSDAFDKREFNLIIKRNPSDLVIVNATDDRITAVQGKERNLECRVTRGQPGGNITLSIDGAVVAKTELSLVSYIFTPNRSDDGKIFKCEAFNSEGESILESSVHLKVFYAPTIDIQYSSNERKMKCIPNGIPDRYMFKDWEHTTEYNDHIRFLPTRKDGNTATLTFPTNVTEKHHHEDRGIYICRASNNISSTDGVFVMQKYYINLTGTPYFVSSTENTQYGVYLKTAMIEIKFVSVPEYTSYEVLKNGSRFTNFTEFDYRNTNVTDNIYGKNVLVKGSILSLQIQIDTPEYFTSYEIVVKNVFGSSNHAIKLVSASAPFIPKILQPSPQQTQILVWWTPGFDGGYRQWFIVEYKEIEDLYWSNQTANLSNSAVIGGLQPATKYLIRIFARNMIDDSNRTEEILVQTDNRVSETNFPAIVSLFAVLLCLLIAAVYFKRGKFNLARFTNQVNSRAIGNDLDALQNGLHTNSDSAAEIPVYSSIDKRHNLRFHQTAAYTVDQKGITNPLKSVHQNRETGKEVTRVSKFGSIKCSSGIEGEKESRELNYIEIFFDQKQVSPFIIHGLDDKTDYVEIDFTQSADPLPDSDIESDTDSEYEM